MKAIIPIKKLKLSYKFHIGIGIRIRGGINSRRVHRSKYVELKAAADWLRRKSLRVWIRRGRVTMSSPMRTIVITRLESLENVAD